MQAVESKIHLTEVKESDLSGLKIHIKFGEEAGVFSSIRAVNWAHVTVVLLS